MTGEEQTLREAWEEYLRQRDDAVTANPPEDVHDVLNLHTADICSLVWFLNKLIQSEGTVVTIRLDRGEKPS